MPPLFLQKNNRKWKDTILQTLSQHVHVTDTPSSSPRTHKILYGYLIHVPGWVGLVFFFWRKYCLFLSLYHTFDHASNYTYYVYRAIIGIADKLALTTCMYMYVYHSFNCTHTVSCKKLIKKSGIALRSSQNFLYFAKQEWTILPELVICI